MASTTGNIGIKLNVPSVRFAAIPAAHSPFTELDDHGLVLDTPRLKEEKNEAYKRRLLEVISRRANSTYQGLVNAITRDLGYSLFKSIRINPRLNVSTNDFIAPDPYIKFDGSYLYLYSDYQNDTLDVKIDRYAKGGGFEHIFRLINRINMSAYFEASKCLNVDDYSLSMTILNQSNRGEVEAELVSASTKFRLEKWPVCKNTVYFSDRDTFRTEVATEAEVISQGKYYIDYKSGYVTIYQLSTLSSSVRYKYHKYPFDAWASPIILHDINNSNFMPQMFEQVLQDDGTYINGAQTTLGIDIINELLGYTPMYWGY